MRILHIFFMMVFTLCLASNHLYARSVFLPDSQDKASIPFNKRISSPITGASNYSDISCSTYGLYSAANRPENADCSFVGSFMEKDCYRCSCSSSYMYDTSNCPSPYVLSKQCLGKYQNCLCNSSTYPAITNDDCGNGYIRDISASCTNISNSITRYKCMVDTCYSLEDQETCEKSNKYCKESNVCSGKCEACVDFCQGYINYEGAEIDCKWGCAEGKYVDKNRCGDVCYAGGCKACTPCEAGYYTAAEITAANAIYATDQVCYDECTDETKYKPTGCKRNYIPSHFMQN